MKNTNINMELHNPQHPLYFFDIVEK